MERQIRAQYTADDKAQAVSLAETLGPTKAAFVGTDPQELGHLGFQDLLNGRFGQGFHPVTVFRHEGFEVDRVDAMLLYGHGMVPPNQDMGLTNIPHTMTSEFAHKSVYYPSPFVRHPNVFYIITDL